MTFSTPLVACIGCHAQVPDLPENYGPAHQYVGTSPGCWYIYGEVGTRALTGTDALSVRGMSADTYMMQHPGVSSRQAIQSVARHLLGLYWALERELPFDKATRAMQRAPSGQFVWLDPPPSSGLLTIVDIAQTSTEAQRIALIKRWAQMTWEAWQAHHETIRRWASLSFS